MKQRPAFGTPVAAGMSIRDVAGALGISKSELHRWCKLADVPQEVFARRLDEVRDGRRKGTATAMLAHAVPARGRVQRVLALVRGMSAAERIELAELVNMENTP